MLKKFICEVVHFYGDNDERVKREHIVYMPKSEYDTSGSRWKNHRWVEKKLEAKLGPQYNPGKTLNSWHVRRIHQEKL